MYDIRFHGRGGQGAVICGNMLAAALAHENKYALSFPLFAGDRRGGPVTAFVRVSNVASEVPRCQIYEPDCLIIMHASLLGRAGAAEQGVLKGFKAGGLILVNSARAPEDLEIPLRATVAAVNATAIAEQHGLGTATARPVNTAILGALCRVTGLVSFDSVEAAIRQEVPEKVAQNLAAAKDAFESVVVAKELSHA
jgi:pyruvate ferredoxin oxidoreductase gamma subunit